MAPKTRHNDRKCVATGAALPPGALALRFVRSPDGVLTPDLAEKLPGRGTWIVAERSALLTALRKGAFARSFKTATTAPDDPETFADGVANQLASGALSRLGLARRQRSVVWGADTVRRQAANLALYISPMDAAPDGERKILAALAATSGAPHIRVPVASDALGAAIGEPGTVHVGLLKAPGAVSVAAEIQRWAQFDLTET